MGVCTRFSPKVATKDSFRYKKSQKIIISNTKSLKTKTKECNQNNLCFSDHFRKFLLSSVKDFLGVSQQASQEIATKIFLKLQPVRN